MAYSSSCSITGVSSIHQFSRITLLGCGSKKGRIFFHSSVKDSTLKQSSFSFIPRAIATTNSVLTEEAFKGLAGISEDSLKNILGTQEEELGYLSVAEKSGGGGKDELALTNLGLPRILVESLEKRGITHLFPIQRAVLLPALEGQDLIARAKTGTGKTLAFGIPIIKRLTEDDADRSSRRQSGRLPRVLVLAPTRELARQVEKEIKESAPYLSTVCVYGGVSYVNQKSALQRGVDVVVGTPGRIIDLIGSNILKLGEVQFLVLDEADQMLAVGFEEDVELILERLPSKRQSMLFSATMPTWVKKLARRYLDNPLTIDLVGNQDEKLAEGIKLYAIPAAASASKSSILRDLITAYAKGGKTIVFTRTKREADNLSTTLAHAIPSEPLHGDKSQYQRERTLSSFRQGRFTVLVATDVASRGLDIPNVDLVVHYELPNDSETFVHRSGRTGRAGKEGTAILMFNTAQKRTVKSFEHDVGCKFEFISLQELAASNRVHSDSMELFTPSAQKSIEEQGNGDFDDTLAQLGSYYRPVSSRSSIGREQFQGGASQRDHYGRYKMGRGGSRGEFREQRGFETSRSWGSGRNSDDEDRNRRGRRSIRTDNSRSESTRTSGEDWLVSSKRSPNRFGSRDRGSFGGSCFTCGRTGHRASECPSKQDY